MALLLLLILLLGSFERSEFCQVTPFIFCSRSCMFTFVMNSSRCAYWTPMLTFSQICTHLFCIQLTLSLSMSSSCWSSATNLSFFFYFLSEVFSTVFSWKDKSSFILRSSFAIWSSSISEVSFWFCLCWCSWLLFLRGVLSRASYHCSSLVFLSKLSLASNLASFFSNCSLFDFSYPLYLPSSYLLE